MIQTPLSPLEDLDAVDFQFTLAAYQEILPGANIRIIPSSSERGISMVGWRHGDLTKQFERYYLTQAQVQVPAKHPAAPIEEELPNTPGDLFEGASAYMPQRSRARIRGRKRQR